MPGHEHSRSPRVVVTQFATAVAACFKGRGLCSCRAPIPSDPPATGRLTALWLRSRIVTS